LLIQVLIFLGGLIILTIAAEFLVHGASRLAAQLGMPPLIVGLTVLAYGTSLPEFVVSVLAAIKDSSPLALGNAMGSNLMNTGLILGAAAILAPITADRALFKRDLPLHLAFTALFGFVILNGSIGRDEGIVMIALMLIYVVASTMYEWRKRGEHNLLPDELAVRNESSNYRYSLDILLILLGSAGLYYGAELMVDSAIYIAEEFDISERVIGLTIVAVGTSLPELATTISAARRKKVDFITGNLIGSNIFNLMLIVGTAGAIAPFAIKLREVLFEYGFLALNAVMIYLFLYTGRKVSRAEGIVLILFYVGFVGFLLWRGF